MLNEQQMTSRKHVDTRSGREVIWWCRLLWNLIPVLGLLCLALYGVWRDRGGGEYNNELFQFIDVMRQDPFSMVMMYVLAYFLLRFITAVIVLIILRVEEDIMGRS